MISKLSRALHSLISLHIFKNTHNVTKEDVKYFKRYLNDKNIFIDTERNIIYIEKNEKPLYKITIEKI